jgi:hypothetical protein
MRWFSSPPGYLLLAAMSVLASLMAFFVDDNSRRGAVFLAIAVGSVIAAWVVSQQPNDRIRK